MVDYTKPTGTTGTMYIRDLGVEVQFLIRSGQSATNVGNLPWSGIVNGVGVGGGFGYPSGNPLVYVSSWNVTYNQSVRFSIANSGTQGLGGPTDFWQSIPRSTVPPAPTQPQFSLITSTTVRVTFSSNGTGGSAITSWELRFGPDGGTILSPQNWSITSSGTSDITDLTPGSYYAAWARGKNANGAGAWSSGNSFFTLPGGRLRSGGIWKNGVPYVKVAGVWKPAVPYVKVGGVWKPAS